MLQRIDSLVSVQDLQSLIPELVLDMGGRLMFSMHVSLGFRNKNSNSLFIGAAGLTMPDASWYDTFAPRNREAQEKVLDYLMSMNKIAGSTPEEAHTISQRTLEAEAMLAQWYVSASKYICHSATVPRVCLQYMNVYWHEGVFRFLLITGISMSRGSRILSGRS